MSIQSRLALGFGFGAIAVASLGYIAATAPAAEVPVVNANVGWSTTTWRQSTQRITIHKRKPLPVKKIDYNQENLLRQIAQEDLMAIEVIVAFVTMET